MSTMALTPRNAPEWRAIEAQPDAALRSGAHVRLRLASDLRPLGHPERLVSHRRLQRLLAQGGLRRQRQFRRAVNGAHRNGWTAKSRDGRKTLSGEPPQDRIPRRARPRSASIPLPLPGTPARVIGLPSSGRGASPAMKEATSRAVCAALSERADAVLTMMAKHESRFIARAKSIRSSSAAAHSH
jgi:hypothetical protein